MMNVFLKRYLGVLLVVLGTAELVYGYFDGELLDNNLYLIAGYGLVFVGLLLYILLDKIIKD